MKPTNKSHVTLRTLAQRSVLWFGKYEGMTVESVIILGHTRYLRHLYYCIEGVSFLPEILADIGIRDDNLIAKPGIDKGMMELVDNIKAGVNRKKCDETGEWFKSNSFQAYLTRKRNYKNFRRADALHYSKARMQAINHGHK